MIKWFFKFFICQLFIFFYKVLKLKQGINENKNEVKENIQQNVQQEINEIKQEIGDMKKSLKINMVLSIY